jgi:hypothetical protein
MELRRNVGGLDRKLRAAGGLALLAVAAWAALGTRPTLAAVAGLGALGLLFNAVTGFCGLNALLGVNTCSYDPEAE